MSVWSKVNLSNLASNLRLDAEYYQPYFLKTEELLRKTGAEIKPLESLLTTITNGHTPSHHDLSIGSVVFLTAEHIDDFMVNLASDKRIELEHHEVLLKRTQLQVHDIILTIKGRIGNAAIVTEVPFDININQDVALLRTAFGVDPYYIAAYLNSTLGKVFTQQISTGQINPFLSLTNLKQLPVPIFLDNRHLVIGDYIRTVLQKHEILLHKSQELYLQAEMLLTHELGLDEVDFTFQQSYISTLTETRQANRIDPEYFQPKYKQIMTMLKRSGKKIKDVAPLAKRKFIPLKDATFHYIEIGNLSEDGYVFSNEVLGEDAPSRAQWLVQSGDVITSTVRPIRRLTAVIEPEQNGYVCSSGFVVLNPIQISPELLMLYLRLPLICEILDLYTTATMYPAISINDLLNFPITLPDDKLQKQIINNLLEARIAKKEATQLLIEAKDRVERMLFNQETL